MAYPAEDKSAKRVIANIQDFAGAEKVSHWYGDGANEFHHACLELGIRHDQADPNRHESNGVIERANRTVIEGTRTILCQSGLP